MKRSRPAATQALLPSRDEVAESDEDEAEYLAHADLSDLHEKPPNKKQQQQKKQKQQHRPAAEPSPSPSLDDEDEGEVEEVEEVERKPQAKRQRRPEVAAAAAAAESVRVAGPLSEARTPAARAARLRVQREAVARLAQLCVAHADTAAMFPHVRALHDVCCARDEDPVVSVLALLSQAAVWRDVLPDYQIRDRKDAAAAASAGDGVSPKLSKPVREKREFESGIVAAYRRFLAFLDDTLRESGGSGGGSSGSAERELAAVRAAAQLLVARPNFNFRENLLDMVVPRLLSKRDAVARECRECVAEVIRTDVSGLVTLDVVRRVGKVLRAAEFQAPPETLEPFLLIRVEKGVVANPFATAAERAADAPSDLQHRSKSQRKMAKAEKLLQKEFHEAEAEYTRVELVKTQTAILDSIFGTYFRVLKRSPHSPLLPAVLRGIAMHARHINVSFMADIVRSVEAVMTTSGLPRRTAFDCARTVLAALRAQGYFADVDLSDFYSAAYAALFELAHAPPAALAASETARSKDDMVSVALESLALLIVEPKNVPVNRVVAFCKRLLTVALCLAPAEAAGVLSVVEAAMRRFPRAQTLLSAHGGGAVGEEHVVGCAVGGRYLPELQEPDHANAWATAAWELSAMQLGHFHPTLARTSAQILAGADPAVLRVNKASASGLAHHLAIDPSWLGIQAPLGANATSAGSPLQAELSPWAEGGLEAARSAADAAPLAFPQHFHEAVVARRRRELARSLETMQAALTLARR